LCVRLSWVLLQLPADRRSGMEGTDIDTIIIRVCSSTDVSAIIIRLSLLLLYHDPYESE
jgi:hypothetical protein